MNTTMCKAKQLPAHQLALSLQLRARKELEPKCLHPPATDKPCVIEPWNRLGWKWPLSLFSPTPLPWARTSSSKPGCLKTLQPDLKCFLGWGISAFLDNLCQCFTTLTVKNFFLPYEPRSEKSANLNVKQAKVFRQYIIFDQLYIWKT